MVVARLAPTAFDRLTWKVRLGLAVVSGRIGTEIVWVSVPGLNVRVPDVGRVVGAGVRGAVGRRVADGHRLRSRPARARR